MNAVGLAVRIAPAPAAFAAQVHDLVPPPVGRDHVAGFRLDPRQRVGQDQEIPDLGMDRQARLVGDLKAGLPEGRIDGPDLRRSAVLDRPCGISPEFFVA